MAACPFHRGSWGGFFPPNGPPSWVALPCFTPQRVRCAAATSLIFCLCLVRDLVLPCLGKSVSCNLMTDVLLLLFSVSNFFSAFLFFFFVPLPTPPVPSVCQMRCRRVRGRCVHFVLALRVFLCVPPVRQIHPRYLRIIDTFTQCALTSHWSSTPRLCCPLFPVVFQL
jgi:hypothetical protein